MKQFLIYVIAACYLFGCTVKDKEVPKKIMPINKMKIIVWDMIQAGSYASLIKEKDTSIKSLNTAYFAEVLKMHNLNKADFFKSFDFYQTHPELNKELFDSVNAYGQRLRGDFYKNIGKPVKPKKL